jgi:hypothetical protein
LLAAIGSQLIYVALSAKIKELEKEGRRLEEGEDSDSGLDEEDEGEG